MTVYPRRSLSIALLLLLGVAYASAQNSQPDSSKEIVSVGLYAGYGMTFIASDFALDGNGMLTPSTECGRFQSGDGQDLAVGGIIEMPISTVVRLALRPEFIAHTGTIRFRCVDPAMTRLPDGSLAPALTDHVAELKGTAIALRLDAAWQPFAFPLQILGGPHIAIPLEVRYTAHEEIVSPSSAEFVSGGQIRPYGDASFASTSPALSLVTGARYRAKVSDRLTLLPEITWRLALTPEVSDASLKFSSLLASLGIVYRIDRSGELPPPAPPAPVPETSAPPILAASLSLHSAAASELSNDTLRVRTSRTIITEVHPLLNFVFFDSGSSDIPARYRRRSAAEIEDFAIQQIRSSDNLAIYYNVLDIIGSRLRNIPTANITLTGTQPDLQTGGSTELARQRATEIASYLTNTWKIAPQRIAIEARVMPATPSNPDRREGSEENRRVEIATNDFRIIEPVLLSDTLRRSTAPSLMIEPVINAQAGIRQWELQVSSSGTQHQTWKGSGPTPASIEWNADSLLTASSRAAESIEVNMTVIDSTGQSRSTASTIPVRPLALADSIRYGAGFYSLILFDFGRSQLSPAHIRTIDLVNARTTSTARAKVFGFTDRLGEESLNLQLSAERAKAVARYLKATVVETVGKGINTELYDNSLPEGRFYSRSVTIETE